MTIEDYLGGLTAYDIPEKAIKVLLAKRGVEEYSMIGDLDEKTQDLITADLYMWCATLPSSKSDTKDSDGNWSHAEGGWTKSAFDSRQLRAMAKDLYDKWGEVTATSSKIRIINL